MKNSKILEAFGDPIGSYAGISAVGAHDLGEPCDKCKMMPDVELECGCNSHEETCEGCGRPVDQCTCQGSDLCPVCGMMSPEPGRPCSCVMSEAKRGGPTKKTAKKIMHGTKSFAAKMKKVSGWANEPAAAAAWMMHKASGKWPSEK